MKSAEGISFLPFIEDGVGKRQHPFYTIAWSRKGLRSVRVGDWKLIAGSTSNWLYLYNLADDPDETTNLLERGKPVTGKALLAGRLCEIYMSEALATPDKARRLQGAAQKQRYNSQKIPIDARTRKELEALGYL
jgi:arylsulfatase A-like enzyme